MSKLNFESYPPLFRPPKDPIQKSDSIKSKEACNKLDMLPIIDMQCLDLVNVDRVCKEWGIFRLVNHGVPINLFKSLQEHAKKIFDMSYEFKQSFISSCPINYFWGTPALTKAGVAVQREPSSRNLDWMEGFHVPFSQLYNYHTLVDDHPLIHSFRNLLKDYSEHITKIGSTIFEAMIKSLELEEQTSREYLDQSTGLVRIYRYPRHNNADEVIRGLHVHTDSSVLSILSEDQVGGLKFLKDDRWLDVQPISGTLIVNLGDMMQVISDDKYKSVKHKVEVNKQRERFSICYFVFPQENTLIHSSNYKPFTYNDFRAQVQLDLQTVGRKIALQSFKLN
ncbi:hypothetical protein RND81_04G156700 [Saponaria officinalis]|uniref:Fe2OG dioxygenase domain-containing protein n=1 Tax=Saponaria officinalis TaxID=3572 RepID=A0AAW1LEG3_SAPOF